MRYNVTIEQRNNGVVAVIRDTETGVEVIGNVQEYGRTKNDKRIRHYQIKFDPTLLGCENKGVVQIPKHSNGKFMLTFETNLDNRRTNTSIDFEDMFA